ncbi:eaa protein [Klebsiella quasipneumoniae]|uniref:eaa protein n=1 Tax=Klebsiella quasipneumoniae TaxID=1463165 RepID=UPI00237CD815|nr:eaa protein [Klebsiella quasipneumoniae]ELB6488190.1 eaa protein [Raoultella ornithinolytica]HDH1451674.1 eaa protein [Klebsiella quasipneumoniae subsp. quasipneumoniae]MDE1587376.1 eaa protein [Klebsiella quasipneumoniae]MDE1598120.1 eaa protein [Klebsiella quasipneumoniae]MDE1603405.1 eaa protein [Klebsiella quasipneumoniae]
MNSVKDKIMQVMTEGANQQKQWAQGEYPFRMATWNIRCAMERKFPGVEWKSADLRKELIVLAKEGLVSKCPHESRIGQAVWRLEVK